MGGNTDMTGERLAAGRTGARWLGSIAGTEQFDGAHDETHRLAGGAALTF